MFPSAYGSSSHAEVVLDGLYDQSRRGQGGTDLEVSCPNREPRNPPQDALKTFHLHSYVASCSSYYFYRFPEPRTGRVIQEIDAKTFEICVRCIYLGPTSLELTHDTVADVLHAAELLGIRQLSNACFSYLEKNLRYENHEMVRELAQRFQNPSLLTKSKRFSTERQSRDELFRAKTKAAEEYEKVEKEHTEISERLKETKSELSHYQQQWTEMVREEDAKSPMEDFLQDEIRDYFTELLIHSSNDKFRFGHVIIRKLEKMHPTVRTPSALWWKAKDLPFDFDPLLLWKSRVAFIQAVKNLRKKLAGNPRYGEKLDRVVDEFQIQASVDRNVWLDAALQQPTNYRNVLNALFAGLSTRAVEILRMWRLEYLQWRRQHFVDEIHSMPCDHAAAARKERHTIFKLPVTR